MKHIMKDTKIYGISEIKELSDEIKYVVAYTNPKKESKESIKYSKTTGKYDYETQDSIMLLGWDSSTLKPLFGAPWCEELIFEKNQNGSQDATNKIYGISEIIDHPGGFKYISAYLDSNKVSKNAMILLAWMDDSLEILQIPNNNGDVDWKCIDGDCILRNELDTYDDKLEEKRDFYPGFYKDFRGFKEHLEIEMECLIKRVFFLEKLISFERHVNPEIVEHFSKIYDNLAFVNEFCRFSNFLIYDQSSNRVKCCDCGISLNLPFGVDKNYDNNPYPVNLSGDEVPNGALAFEKWVGFFCEDCFEKQRIKWNKKFIDENREWHDYQRKCAESSSGMVCCICGDEINDPYSAEEDCRTSTVKSGMSYWYYCSEKCEKKSKELNLIDAIQ